MTGYVYRDPRRGRHVPTATEANVARAITTPDSVTGRRQHEGMVAWQARAVLDVIVTAVREGREPFAGIWDDAVAAGREDERARWTRIEPDPDQPGYNRGVFDVSGFVAETYKAQLAEAVAAERGRIVARLRGKHGDDLAQMLADMLEEP